MYKKLASEVLRTGEEMEVGVVEAPDEEFREPLVSFLSHKSREFRWHIERSLEGPLDELETRFYIGRVEGEIVTNVMTVEYNRTGILGHVYTKPEHRRKGACTGVLRTLIDDFRGRGGGVLLLGTGYGSPAYWIYHRFGFRSLEEGSGFMRYTTEEDFEGRFFSPVPVRVVDVAWHDWPRLNLLASVPGREFVRSIYFGLFGIKNLEGVFLQVKRDVEEGRCRAKLLESESGAVVGCATVVPDPRWEGSVYLLDFFTHPEFLCELEGLLDSLELPDGKLQSYVEVGAEVKAELLFRRGFREEAVLRSQVEDKEGRRLDLRIFSKGG